MYANAIGAQPQQVGMPPPTAPMMMQQPGYAQPGMMPAGPVSGAGARAAYAAATGQAVRGVATPGDMNGDGIPDAMQGRPMMAGGGMPMQNNMAMAQGMQARPKTIQQPVHFRRLLD